MFCVEEHKWDYFTRIYRYTGEASSPGGGDAFSLGGDASLAGEDTLHSVKRAPYARVHNIYLETFFCSMFHLYNAMH